MDALLDQLNDTMAQLFEAFEGGGNPERMVYEEWTAKDILGHLTFWHESFARNVSDLVNDTKPRPLKGSFADLNQRCLEEMRPRTVEDLLQRLQAAHRVIQEHILNPKLNLIPYRKGSRAYTPEEHLVLVNEHIKGHLNDIIST